MNGNGAATALRGEDGSTARHLSLLEFAPVGLFETDAEGNCLFVNRRWCELAGMTPEQAQGTGWVRALHPEDRDRVRREWYEAAATGREFLSEYRFRTPSGRVNWLQGSATAVRGDSGDVVGFVGTITDISVRKEAEAERDRRTAELQAIFDTAPVGINLAHDPECRVITGNRALAEILGMPPGANVSKSRSDAENVPYVVIKDGGALPVEGLPMQRAARDGIDVRDEIVDIVRGDGSRVTVLVNASPVRDADGAINGAVGICADVTALRESERRLALSEAWLRLVTDSLPVLVSYVDRELRLRFANAAYEAWFGLAPTEVIGRTVRELLGDEVFSHRRPFIEAALRGELVRFEGPTDHAQLGRRQAEIIYRPHFEDGRVAGYFVHVLDINERKEAQAALQDSRALLHAVVEAIPVGIGVTDAQGRVLSLNPAGLRLLGFASPDEILVHLDQYREEFALRRPDGSVLPIEEWPLPMALAGTFVRDYEVRLRRRSGEERVVTFSVVPVRHKEGEPHHFVFVLHDITGRKWSEEELRRLNDELRQADRRKDEFLATLAHELRNPLAPIRNALEILKAPGLVEAYRAWNRDLIDRQVRQMTRLLDDLLDVSRIARGKAELRRQRIDLSKVLEASVETSRPMVDAGHHKLTVSLPTVPIPMDADPARLAQVFSNLLNNAAKYTEPGGHIWLTAECDGDRAIVSVRDTGIGIDPAHLPRIFDIFSQESTAMERSQGGIGIGLSLVKGLVELHGGRVEARSAGAGMGSEFTVSLPLAEPPAPPASGPVTAVDATRRPATLRILVVDDNVDAARSLARLLELSGHEVEMAHDGLEAVQAAGASRPDVVLMDIGLPRLNGYEAAARIRSEPWGKGMWIVALTGWGQESDRIRAMEAGCDHHLTKPVDPAILAELLAARAARTTTPPNPRGTP